MYLSYSNKSYIPPIHVPGSKSITNRLLVLKQLYFQHLVIGNASKSTDSEALSTLLLDMDKGITDFYVEDGGTTFRFLLSTLAIKNIDSTISCGKTLLSRPHDGLITALNDIGFNISKTNTGFLIKSVDLNSLLTHWHVDISTSSQYATALLLIAPLVGKPIQLSLTGKAVSKGYLKLTAALMQDLGIDVDFATDDVLNIQPKKPSEESMLVTVESDWSAISYFVLLSKITGQTLTIHNVNANSIQPDKDTLEFGKAIGLNHTFNDDSLVLQPIQNFSQPAKLKRDYTNCPDLAPTEIVGCFALGIELIPSGNAHLKYKESNRAEVLSLELLKFKNQLPSFKTHQDHRIAMSLTALSVIKPIELDNIEVVSKSFPDFWQEVSKLGIHLKLNND